MASTSATDPSSAMKKSPNWLEMPEELMITIFQRLPTLEILKSARKVCKTWQRICKDPSMWKVISILRRRGDGCYWHHGVEALAKEAVDLSCGELIDISLERFVTRELLYHIVLSSSKLKRLCLVSCWVITDSALSLACKRVPQLEKLHLSDTCICEQDLEVIGRNCPQLKSFELSIVFRGTYITGDDHAHAIANSMPELRHLDLRLTEITNNGLEAILNGCPHLESLDVRECDKLDLDGYLGKMCMKQIKDFKHTLNEECVFLFDHISDVEDFSEGDMYDDFSESDDFYQD